MSSKDKKVYTPRFGDVVAWYRQANRNNTPHPATVSGVSFHPVEGPILRLIIHQADRPNEEVTGSRHVDSPVLKERPRGLSIAKDNGGWESREDYEARLQLEQEDREITAQLEAEDRAREKERRRKEAEQREAELNKQAVGAA